MLTSGFIDLDKHVIFNISCPSIALSLCCSMLGYRCVGKWFIGLLYFSVAECESTVLQYVRAQYYSMCITVLQYCILWDCSIVVWDCSIVVCEIAVLQYVRLQYCSMWDRSVAVCEIAVLQYVRLQYCCLPECWMVEWWIAIC